MNEQERIEDDGYLTPIESLLTPLSDEDVDWLSPERQVELDRRLVELGRARRRAWREICAWWP